jgi:hypothetical protein
MGLSKGLLHLLQAKARLWPEASVDVFGNDVPSTSVDILCFIDGMTDAFGTGSDGSTVRSTPNETTQITTDALGIKLADKIEFQVFDLTTQTYIYIGAVKRKVTNVVTYRDKQGIPLFQQITTETL